MDRHGDGLRSRRGRSTNPRNARAAAHRPGTAGRGGWRRAQHTRRPTPPPHDDRADTDQPEADGGEQTEQLIERREELPFVRRDPGIDHAIQQRPL